MDAVYILHQVFTNPRDHSTFSTVYGEFDSLAEAKKEAKSMKRWVIFKQTVAARSAEIAERV